MVVHTWRVYLPSQYMLLLWLRPSLLCLQCLLHLFSCCHHALHRLLNCSHPGISLLLRLVQLFAHLLFRHHSPTTQFSAWLGKRSQPLRWLRVSPPVHSSTVGYTVKYHWSFRVAYCCLDGSVHWFCTQTWDSAETGRSGHYSCTSYMVCP